MKGNDQVLQQLSILLRGELAARDQYFTHSRMYADWGLTKLYERINYEMQDEVQHAAALIERILFLEGTPDLSQHHRAQLSSMAYPMAIADSSMLFHAKPLRLPE